MGGSPPNVLPTTPSYGVVALAAAAIIFDGVDNQMLAFTTPSLLREWAIPHGALAVVAALGLVGMTLGSLVAGVLGDRLGRRPILVGATLLFALATVAMGLAAGPVSLAGLRFVAGLGLGGAMPNAAAFAAEYSPPDRRPIAVTATMICIPAGGLLAGLIARIVLAPFGWRGLFFCGGGLALGIALLLLLLPSTPNTGPTVARGDARALLAPGRARDTIFLWVAFLTCLLAVYTMFLWLPALLADAGLSLVRAGDGLAAFNFGGIVGAIVVAVLIARIGSRRPLVCLSGLGALVAGGIVVMPAMIGAAAYEIIVCALLGFAILGVQTTLFSLATHLYPFEIRATGVGFALGLGRLGALLSAFGGSAVIADGDVRPFFLLIAGAMTMAAISLNGIRRHIRPQRG